MGHIDKWIEPIEKQIPRVNNIGRLKMDKTVTIRMGMGHMFNFDSITVKMKFDIPGKGTVKIMGAVIFPDIVYCCIKCFLSPSSHSIKLRAWYSTR